MSTPTAHAPISTETAREQPASSSNDEAASAKPSLEDELLIEEISIDGMCGVY